MNVGVLDTHLQAYQGLRTPGSGGLTLTPKSPMPLAPPSPWALASFLSDELTLLISSPCGLRRQAVNGGKQLHCQQHQRQGNVCHFLRNTQESAVHKEEERVSWEAGQRAGFVLRAPAARRAQ